MNLLYVDHARVDSQTANVVQMVNMCQAFAQNGVDVTWVIAAARNERLKASAIAGAILDEKPGFEIITYPKLTPMGRFEILGSYPGASSLLKKLPRPDVCFVRDPLMLTLSMNLDWFTVFEAHSSVIQTRYPLLDELWRREVLRNVKKAPLARFVAISGALMRYWRQKGVPEEKLLVLHDGFSDHILGAEIRQADARAMLGLPPDRKIAVYSGSLQPDRGIERIILLAKRFSETLFIVLGGPDDCRSIYEAQAARAGLCNIRWPGFVPHPTVAKYLFAADVLLLLRTQNDPFIDSNSPLKLFEYMAAGRIIVAEAFPTVLEVIDERTAFLAQPALLDDLSEKLSQALAQCYPSPVATLARQMAIGEYTWVRRTRKILDSVNALPI